MAGKKRRISKLTRKVLPLSDKEIIRYYTENDSGMTLGYALYNRRNISTQIAKTKYIISNIPTEETLKIKRITIKKVDINFTYKVKEHIEVVEVIDKSHFGSYIQDFNESAFYKMIEEFKKSYDKETLDYVINKMSYKKETINKVNELIQSGLPWGE